MFNKDKKTSDYLELSSTRTNNNNKIHFIVFVVGLSIMCLLIFIAIRTGG